MGKYEMIHYTHYTHYTNNKNSIISSMVCAISCSEDVRWIWLAWDGRDCMAWRLRGGDWNIGLVRGSDGE